MRIFHPIIFLPLLLVIFLAAVIAAKVLLWPAIKLRQSADHKNSAQEYLESENYRNAFLEIQKAILKDPTDIESYSMALAAAEKSEDLHHFVPGYLRKLIEVGSDNPDHYHKYILLCLRLDAHSEAKSAFEQFPESAKNTTQYHQIGYSLGSGLNDYSLAEHHISKLVELNPEDTTLQFFQSALHLRSSEDEVTKTSAQSSLEQFASTNEGRVPGLRVLLTHSLVERNKEQVENYVAELAEIDNLSVVDRLLLLQSKKFLDIDSFPQAVEQFLKDPIADPVGIHLTVDFLLQNQLEDLAAAWVETIPEETRLLPVASRKVAQVYYKTEDWISLRQHLTDGDWDGEDYGRLLLLALACRNENDITSYQNHWKECLVQAGTDKTALQSIFQSVVAWGWTNQGIEVLEIIFHEEPSDDEIFQSLINHFMSSGDTSRAIQVLSRRAESLPYDLDSKNNLVLLALLSGLQEPKIFRYAEENFTEDKSNPYYLTTWAFTLTFRNRADEASKLVAGMSAEQRNDPQRAVYLAQIFLAAGKLDLAEEYASKADPSRLFAEEKSLLESIQTSLQEARE